MSMSFARPSRRAAGLAAAAVTSIVLLAGCASGTTAGSTPSATETQAADVQVIKMTNTLLVTAKETLEASGLVVQYADATGQGRPIDDLNDWVVVTQDPISGTVPEGSDVTLTVRMTSDPRM
ncbi:MAG TPA: hypothetical protein VGC57_09250 [Cellulomonas sp.]